MQTGPEKPIRQCPESSALGNAVNFWLATLAIALPLKNLCLKLPNSVRNAKNFGGNAIGNVANQKSTTFPRPDDSDQWSFPSGLAQEAL